MRPIKNKTWWLALVGCLSIGAKSLDAQAPTATADMEPDVYAELQSNDIAQRLMQLEMNQQRLEGIVAPTSSDDSLINPIDRGFSLFPDYAYRQSYYDYGYGRELPDYAPYGYEARDQQEGPAEPEFTRLTAPPRITAEERRKYVTRGMYPGSLLAPGTNTSVRFRGFARLAAMYDLNPIGSADSFVTNTIPVPQGVGQNFNMSGRISRFAMETWTPTSFREWHVHTLIEGDFFNGPAQAAGGGGNPFRLRHAFIDFGIFRFGQQNTVFMDATNWPSLVDFQGPNSWTNQRQPSARMTIPILNRMYWATSIERPFSDITAVDSTGASMGTNVQDVPDFATHWRFEADRGHIQVGGLLRTIGFRPTAGTVERLTASGISGNAVFHPWSFLLGTNPVQDSDPSGLTRSRILLQATAGQGVSRYMNDLAAQGLDAQVDPVTGEFQLVNSAGWNASYEHWMNERWLMNVTYGNVNVKNNAGQPGGTYSEAHYLAGSLWWIPVPRFSLAVEWIAGQRDNLDGQSADVQRINSLAQYNF